MIPEIGHFALILALSVAIVQAALPLIGAQRGIPGWIAVAKPAAQVHFMLLLISFGCLVWAFVTSDFSVFYVASNSNTLMPQIYKISAVWGAHEGSLLLWAFLLSGWGVMVSIFGKGISAPMLARVLSVMAMISIGFLLFMLLTSNPFERIFPVPAEGRTLNPLLQDPGLAIHPPMLYMGYVGFSVAFAFAVAAMLSGRLDSAWARWSRPWTNIAWVFLTIGITLGSWWAYYELGWGGWWFWDPVENASFMPWLVGTALIHSLAVTEKRGMFKAWTVLLAIFAFSLSLLGTFLVRSGVLTSVHAFATDPERGIFILVFLALVVGGSLMLYAWRAPQIRAHGAFELQSREAAILMNNILLVVAAVTILLGTLYPLIVDALGFGKLSVGPPYFNSVFIPLMVPLAVLVGIGALTRWKKDSFMRLAKKLAPYAVISVIGGFALPMLLTDHTDWRAVLGVTLALWVALTTLHGVWERIANRPNKLKALFNLPGAFWGMTLAHFGIAIFCAGVSLVSVYTIEKDIRLEPGQEYELGGYTFTFQGVKTTRGPNYVAEEGVVEVSKNGKFVQTMRAQKRNYGPGTMPMTEAAIDPSLLRDLYVALGEPIDAASGAWAVRIYYKPFVRWLWLAGIFMALGGIAGAFDKRYRMRKRVAAENIAKAGATA
ncbi:MAG: c-type cytochrome biogenesis protein CcmF [Gammaproteobacteria bacterium]|nr:MAG: c-type cytochrome biogenesis protein CcmF [Gammaproteobacteria bacterium]RTZ61104.1 MAG: c-type cytochrome biogenesis protein CcmF [Gammaproteobacteria bacterium]